MAITPKKKALLAKIHIAKKDLCLDDGTYRDVLRRVTGKDSSSKMLMSELERVIYEFGNRGWKPSAAAKPKHGKKPSISDDKPNRQAIMDKIEAILADMGLHWNYAHGMAKRMFGKEQVQWLDDEQLYKLMQALQVDQNRRKRRTVGEVNDGQV